MFFPYEVCCIPTYSKYKFMMDREVQNKGNISIINKLHVYSRTDLQEQSTKFNPTYTPDEPPYLQYSPSFRTVDTDIKDMLPMRS